MGLGPLFAIPTPIRGSTGFAIKFQLGDVAPEDSVAYRFALAAVGNVIALRPASPAARR